MNRREFSKTLGAAAVAPALPVKLAASVTKAVPVVSYGMDPYIWAKYTALINNHLSPDLLKSVLGMSRSESKAMIARLVREQVIQAPNAAGISKTSAEYITRFKHGSGASEAVNRLVDATKDQLKNTEFLNDDLSSDDPIIATQEDAPSTADNSQPA